ncbi:hypothetical protein [Halosimplex amylolyticum]|uniref:hypothetical protein n=1 Tax=Halosimplex amylolyticum TaxID=3396616 RepID=UPI003F55D86C
MRAAAISRVVSAPPDTVAERLTPEAVIEGEGRYAVKDVATENGRTVVTAWPAGRLFPPQFAFEERPDGFVYRRLDDGRPLVTTETTVTLRPEGDGTRVDVESEVRASVPVPLIERSTVRQRRRDVERLCERLDAIVGERSPEDAGAAAPK